MTSHINISKRLEFIADNIRSRERIADIGTDHAYLPCYICAKDNSVFAIAGEVQEGPLLNAKQTVKKYGLSEQVSVRLGNGLSVINKNDDIDTIVIAGMGGKLITTILHDPEKLQLVNRLIVQPNTNEKEVRKFLYKHHFNLEKEEIIEENGIIYEVFIAHKQTENKYKDTISLEMQFMFGPTLLEKKPALFIKKWKLEKEHLKQVLMQMKRAKQQDEKKVATILKQIKWIEEALS